MSLCSGSHFYYAVDALAIRVSADILAVISKLCHGFLQSLLANFAIVPFIGPLLWLNFVNDAI